MMKMAMLVAAWILLFDSCAYEYLMISRWINNDVGMALGSLEEDGWMGRGKGREQKREKVLLILSFWFSTVGEFIENQVSGQF